MATTSISSDDARSPTQRTPEEELARKRARDRKSQRAMRERTKSTIQSLSEQVAQLTQALNAEVGERAAVEQQMQAVSEENERLRAQTAALQLRLLGGGASDDSGGGTGAPAVPQTPCLPPWEVVPLHIAPMCISDQIMQGFLQSRLELGPQAIRNATPDIVDLGCLLSDQPCGKADDASKVVADVVKSYKEIETLPKQVAVHYCILSLLKWLLLRSEESYYQLPEFLRPVPAQLRIPHPFWMDRIPWPEVRTYLVENRGIAFDDYAAAYSSQFTILWDYDPKLVVMKRPSSVQQGHEDAVINPVYEEHIRQLKNWTVAPSFKRRFPKLASLIDEAAQRP